MPLLNFQDKKQKKLLIVFVIIMIITSAVLYFKYFNTNYDTDDQEFINMDMEEELEISIDPKDLDILNDPKFQELKSYYGDLNDLAPKGRANPFAPY
ncbi:hypothetical protein CL633_03755 [bacterium]|nr:hypothetical protein [bacterium]|tara:strand:+ start:3815 stop:4105 length:291 start_codon:yes stop_codon:yes gene_type:complete